MWSAPSDALPPKGEQVIGVYHSGVAYCTLTDDGWYASDSAGNLGHRDAWRKDESKGPILWTAMPTLPPEALPVSEELADAVLVEADGTTRVLFSADDGLPN